MDTSHAPESFRGLLLRHRGCRPWLQKTRNPYTAQDLASAQAAVDQRQAQLRSAQLSLSDTRVVTPVHGVIADVQVAAGALVSPSTVLMTLV